MPSPNTTPPSFISHVTSSAAPAGEQALRQLGAGRRRSATPRARRSASASSLGRGQRAARTWRSRCDARRPAGRAGPGRHDQAGGRLALGALADARARSARTGADVADEDLVERQQLLAVVEPRAPPSCGPRAPRARAATSASRSAAAAGGWRTSTPAAPGSGLTPITGCPSRYFATLATSPSWPSDHHDVVGLEEEAVELRPRNRGAPPVARDRGRARSPGPPPARVAAARPRRACGRARGGRSGPARACRDARAARVYSVGRSTRTARGSIVTPPVASSSGASRSGVTVDARRGSRPARAAPAPAAPRPASRSGSPPARARPAAAPPRRGRSCRPRARPRAAPARRSRCASTPSVGGVLRDQLLLAARELDPVLQLVLGDRPLLLDRQRAPREGGLVGLLLDRLAGRRRSAFSTSAVGVTAATRTATISRPSSPSAGSAASPPAMRSRIGSIPSLRIVRRSHPHELVDHELLRELGEQRRDLLERRLRPAARSAGRCEKSTRRPAAAGRRPGT